MFSLVNCSNNWTQVQRNDSYSLHRGNTFHLSLKHAFNPTSSLLNNICSVAQSCPTLCDPMDCSTHKHTLTYRHQMHQFSSVAQSCPTLCDPMNRSQHARPPCPSPTPRAYSNSCASSWWCHPAISSSVFPFSACPQSLPASGSFPMSQLFASDSQSIRVSASASVLPMNIQDWSPLGWTGWISLQSKGLSRVFSYTTVQKHQFFGTQLFSQSNSHIHRCINT